MAPIDAIDLDFSGNIVPLPVRDKDPSVKIEFRFMSSIKSEVERIIKERIFNYRTPSEFYRHAVWNQLLLLKELSPKMKKRVSWQEAVIRRIQAKERFREYQSITNYLSREVEALERTGEPGQARQLALEVINLINEADMPDDMKKRYFKRIMKRHGRLLRQLNGS